MPGLGVHRHNGRFMHPSMQLQCHGKGRCHTHRWQIEGDEVLCSGPIHVVAGGPNEGAQPCHRGVRHIQHLQYSADLSKVHCTLPCKRWLTCGLGRSVPMLLVRQPTHVKLTRDIDARVCSEGVGASFSDP